MTISKVAIAGKTKIQFLARGMSGARPGLSLRVVGVKVMRELSC